MAAAAPDWAAPALDLADFEWPILLACFLPWCLPCAEPCEALPVSGGFGIGCMVAAGAEASPPALAPAGADAARRRSLRGRGGSSASARAGSPGAAGRPGILRHGVAGHERDGGYGHRGECQCLHRLELPLGLASLGEGDASL